MLSTCYMHPLICRTLCHTGLGCAPAVHRFAGLRTDSRWLRGGFADGFAVSAAASQVFAAASRVFAVPVDLQHRRQVAHDSQGIQWTNFTFTAEALSYCIKALTQGTGLGWGGLNTRDGHIRVLRKVRKGERPPPPPLQSIGNLVLVSGYQATCT